MLWKRIKKESRQEYVFTPRFSGGKSPTITMTSFFFSFFCQTTDLIVYIPRFTDFTRSCVLVTTVFTPFTVNPVVKNSSPCFNQKLFQQFFPALRRSIFFRIAVLNFFRHCAPFLYFFCLQRVLHSSFVDILQQTKVPKNQNGLPFHVFWHYETVQHSHFSFCFENLKKFQNLFCLQRIPL